MMGHPSVYPTGVTIYKPEKCWNGYNLVQTIRSGALLFDMNGNEIRRWDEFHGFPNKLLPNGDLIGYSGDRNPRYGMQDGVDLVQIDYDGNIVWKFDKFEFITDKGEEPRYMARSHHDYQREGNPVGYYVPNQLPQTRSGNTLILGHTTLSNEKISPNKLLDDVFYEVDWQGNIVWQWKASDHIDEIGFSEEARQSLFNNPNIRAADGGVGDWLHINCMSYLGENKWYSAGDERFHPENIIFDSREANFIAIISKKTGQIVWQIGPNWQQKEVAHISNIIGPHHAHLIPQGLPGAGNILVFDNGGWGGYGSPNPASPDGTKNTLRDYSRVLEINPITLEIEWQFTPEDIRAAIPTDASKFYSPYVSSAQRLPNGNTLIDEGSNGRLIEVTREKEIVWEWISPYFSNNDPDRPTNNMIYRGYRYPYDWVPQEPRPIETAIEPIDVVHFRVPNAGKFGAKSVVKVAGTLPYQESAALCVAKTDETTDKPKLFTVNTQLFSIVTEQNFENSGQKIILQLFGAERCVHCKTLHPVLEKILQSDLAKWIKAEYVDVDHNPKLTELRQIRGIPTVILSDQEKELGRKSGELSYTQLYQWLSGIIHQGEK
ncbi:aryl-sulfate sulfotransferase [Lonepinella koalarum]|uniref:aryl-sulfate sulfotransferase n=1 Tax=Lonepinella koalarum TaxID=53417 RepID=UPI003F6DAD37